MVATQWIVKYREVPTVAVLELKLLHLDSKILVLYQPIPVHSSSNSQFGQLEVQSCFNNFRYSGMHRYPRKRNRKKLNQKIGEIKKWGGARTQTEDKISTRC